MTKQEILTVLYKMLADWQYCYDNPTYDNCFARNTESGFCNYLDYYPTDKHIIIGELRSGYDYLTTYWYSTVSYKPTEIKKTLLPRIDHLKQTIARLENEIAIDNIQFEI